MFLVKNQRADKGKNLNRDFRAGADIENALAIFFHTGGDCKDNLFDFVFLNIFADFMCCSDNQNIFDLRTDFCVIVINDADRRILGSILLFGVIRHLCVMDFAEQHGTGLTAADNHRSLVLIGFFADLYQFNKGCFEDQTEQADSDDCDCGMEQAEFPRKATAYYKEKDTAAQNTDEYTADAGQIVLESEIPPELAVCAGNKECEEGTYHSQYNGCSNIASADWEEEVGNQRSDCDNKSVS